MKIPGYQDRHSEVHAQSGVAPLFLCPSIGSPKAEQERLALHLMLLLRGELEQDSLLFHGGGQPSQAFAWSPSSPHCLLTGRPFGL